MSKRKACQISVHIPEVDAETIFEFFQDGSPTKDEFKKAIWPDIVEYKDKVLVIFEYSMTQGVGFEKAEIVTPFQWFAVQNGEFTTNIGEEGQDGGGIFKELTFDDCSWSVIEDPLKIRGAQSEYEETDEISVYWEGLSEDTKVELAIDYLKDSSLDQKIIRRILESLSETAHDDDDLLAVVEALVDV